MGQGPHAKGPGPKGPRDQRALRALWAKGPFGPLGPFGAQGGRLYARNAIPNGIDDAQRKLFRMESVQGKSIYGYFEQIENARDTYINS